MPESVRTPVPVLVRPPPIPEITPLNVVLELFAPVVSVPAPRARLPAPDIDATVLLKPARFQVAPDDTLTVIVSASALVAPWASVPALMVVAPV